MRIFCIVSYKGTRYAGWERQVGQLGIQEVIENAISQILNQKISIYGSGRTDAGVHAHGQTFHFDVDEVKYEASDLMYRINCVLPPDIKIEKLEFLENNEFHARFAAKSKEYRYFLSLNAKDPFKYETSWLLKTNTFDVELLKKAVKAFEGEHCFINFTSKEEDKDNYVREIFKTDVIKTNDEIEIIFVGNGFMRYQIRFMVGTAVQVAMGNEPLEYISNKLENTLVRTIVPYKAQPQGLVLEKVNY